MGHISSNNVFNHRKFVLPIIIIILIFIVVFIACLLSIKNNSDDPAKIVGKYDTGTLGGRFVDSGKSAYEIGMNKYGQPVFADIDAAFAAIKDDCAAGFAYLAEEFDLPGVTKHRYDLYKTYGWQSGAGDETVRKQCMEISQFFDIFENSFSVDNAVVRMPETDGDSVYTAGELLAQNGALSYLPQDGSYYAQIILSNHSLTVISRDGETLFANGESAVSQMLRPELINKLEAAYLLDMDNEDVPDYDSIDDMVIYSYYPADGSESIISYKIFWFNGEPTWFVEGDLLRIYSLEPVTE